jgi:hypothetical protein
LYFLLFPVQASRFQVYIELILAQGEKYGYKVSVFCRQISSFSRNICWRCCLFSILCFWCLCQKIRWA